MTAKERAKDLYNKFNDYADCNYGGNKFEQNWFGYVLAGERKVRKESTKQCVLIAVDELIYETQFEVPNVRQKYWLDVKQEIEKL